MQLPPNQRKHAEFEAILHRYYPEVWALAYALWKNVHEANDIAQEVFLRFWMQWVSGAEIGNVRAWLLRVARNLAADYARSAFRRNGTHGPEIMNKIVSDEPSREASMQRAERLKRLPRAIHKLPQHYADVIRLRFYAGFKPRDIAALQSTTVATIKGRLRRGLDCLRKLMRDLRPDADDHDGAAENSADGAVRQGTRSSSLTKRQAQGVLSPDQAAWAAAVLSCESVKRLYVRL
jgi:RNA polymerase sigma-70 factor (ECF subfamily)